MEKSTKYNVKKKWPLIFWYRVFRIFVFLFIISIFNINIYCKEYILKFSIPKFCLNEKGYDKFLFQEIDSLKIIDKIDLIFSDERRNDYLVFFKIKLKIELDSSIFERIKQNKYFAGIWTDELNTVNLINNTHHENKDKYFIQNSIFNDTYRGKQWYLGEAPEKTIENISEYLETIKLNSVKVAIIDSGLPDYLIINGELSESHAGGYNFVNGSEIINDELGHGSHINGIIHAKQNNSKGVSGIAKNLSVYNFKVINKDGKFYDSDLIKAIKAAIDSNVKIINLSLTTQSSACKDIIEIAKSRNIILVSAVGNDGLEKKLYPAAFDSVLSIGSCDRDFKRSKFSNYGDYIDFLAPGENICSLSSNPYSYINYLSGTSQSAAIVTGIVSLFLSIDSTLTYSHIYNLLVKSTYQTNDSNNNLWKRYYGNGIISFQKVYENILKLTSIGKMGTNLTTNNKLFARNNEVIIFNHHNLSIPHIQLYDYTGRNLDNNLYSYYNDKDRIVFDITNLNNGIYYIIIDNKPYIFYK